MEQATVEPVLTCPVRLPANHTVELPQPHEVMPFYLHQDPALDIRPLLACFQLLLNLEPDASGLIPMKSAAFGSVNADFALRAITDAAYVEALRRHPLRRSEQKQAKLTIIAMSPLLSASLPDGHPVCANLTTLTHVQRMEKAQRVLSSFLEKPRAHVTALFCTGCNLDILGLSLHDTLRKLHPLILSSSVQAKENEMRFGPKKTVLKRVSTLVPRKYYC